MKKLIPLFIIAFSVITFAQQPDRWHGLVLDEATPEQAIAVLGQPKSDKVEKNYLINYKWLKKDIWKDLRILHWEDIEGFPDVKLAFSSDSKLRVIHLEPKKISAQSFISSYPDIDFRFGNEVMSPADLKRPRDNTDRPQRLEAWYILVGATDKAFVFGGVGNSTGTVMSGMFGNAATRQGGRSTPGNVKMIQLISRTLENKDGSDLLK